MLLDESRDATRALVRRARRRARHGRHGRARLRDHADDDRRLARPPGRSGCFALSAVLLVGFVVWELRQAEPLMRFGILRVRTVLGANVAGFILGASLFAMFLMLTLYAQQVLGYSPMRTGFAYLTTAGSAILFAGVAAQLVTRIGAKPVMVVGMAAMTLGLLLFTQVSVGGSYARRPAARLPRDRDRDPVRVRADHDRRARRRAARGGRASRPA